MSSQSPRLAPVQKQTLKLKLSQRLLQSIKLMAMPVAELRETIQEEADNNPALDIVREAGEVDAPAETENRSSEEDPFINSSDPGWQPSAPGDPDSKQRFLEGALSREASLNDRLIEQIRIIDLSDTVASLAEKLVGNLDEDGFHREPPDLVTTPEEKDVLEDALEVIRALDPLGCGCADWRESLVVQARIRGDAPEDFDRFVNQGLILLETKKTEDVRQTMGIDQEEWEFLEIYIQELNPFPGRLYSTEAPRYIIPDLEVRKDEGEYLLYLNDEALPVLQVDPLFEELREEQGTDKEARKFLSRHVQDARYFINSLAQRENTLLKTAKAIVEFQRDFFRGGPRYLKPLTLKDVAEEIGVHEATVSRITTNKYVQTEWGLYELKYFFTNSISGAGSSGSRISKEAAKQVILEILREAPPEKRLSDQKITVLLAKRGINIARRTVAKYRGELDLPSSYRR